MKKSAWSVSGLWLTVLMVPAWVFAQDRAAQIDAATAAYHAGRPAEAVQLLRSILDAPDAEALPSQTLAQAYTYLAMSLQAGNDDEEASTAVAAAVRADATVFRRHGMSWAKKNRAIVDTAVAVVFREGAALYEDAEFEAAAGRLRSALELDEVIARPLAVKIHTYLAFIYVAMRQSERARREFHDALWIDPDLDLGDASVISPKIRREFLAIRENTLKKSRASMRRNTLLRSLILPGWGQLYRGKPYQGYGLMAAQAVLLTGMVLSMRSYHDARDAYRGFGAENALAVYLRNNSIEEVNKELDARYGRYKSKGRQANAFIALSAGIWGLNMLDAFILTLRRNRVRTAGRTNGPPSHLAANWNPDTRQWSVGYRITW